MTDNSHNGLLVNVGCGQTRPAGWVNTDSSLNSFVQSLPLAGRLARGATASIKYEQSAKYMDLRRRWPFADGSCTVVYASHVLEHLSVSQADHFLKESRRVLAPSGIIRIVVPDLQALARIYLDELNKGHARASERFLYNVNMHAENSYHPGRRLPTRAVNAVQGHPHQHKYMYDKESLRVLLTTHGFRDLREASYGISTYISRILDVENTSEGVPSIYFEGMS